MITGLKIGVDSYDPKTKMIHRDGVPVCFVARRLPDPDEWARLFAAAPDLLDCLREQSRLLDQYLSGALVVFPSAIRHQSRAAIAKATGGAA